MMLSRKLLIASVAFIILTAAISAAPVEDKEPEENDFEAEEGEEELSEEEEDDDDSNGQHIKGAGAQRPTMVPKGPGVTVLPGTSLVGEPPNGQVNEAASAQTNYASSSGSATASGRDSQAFPSSSQVLGVAGHWSSASKVPGAADTAHSDTVSHGSSQVSLSHVSSGQDSSHVSSLMASAQTSGSVFVSSEVQTQTEEAAPANGFINDNADGESQTAYIGSQFEAPGNGHKHLINGQETGHSGINNFMEDTTPVDLTGGFDSFGSNMEITGIIDHSSNDFLIGLIGGMRDSFAPDLYTDTTGVGLNPGLSSFISSAPTDFSVTSDNGAQYYSPGEMTEGADNNGANSASINGNGRLRPVTDIHKGDPDGAGIHLYTKEHQGLLVHTDMAKSLTVTDPTVSTITYLPLESVVTPHAAGVGMHTDVTDIKHFEGEPVTNGHRQIDITIMGESIYSSRPPDTLGYESTGMTEGFSNHTDSVIDTSAGMTDASQTHIGMVQTGIMVTVNPAGVSSQTDATGTAVAEPQGTLRGLSQPGATEQTQPAVSAGEQYHTSGQGPEGAENVELEDTC